MSWVLSREGRKWIYGICLAAVPLLVLYGVIDESAARCGLRFSLRLLLRRQR